MLRRVALVVAGAVGLGGCATLTRGTSEAFVVETDPPGAQVRFSSGEQCVTPCALKKKRKDSFVVHIEKDGYEPVEVQVTNQVAGGGAAGMAGNLVFGGLVGAAVDASTGATLQLVPNPVRVHLVPLSAGRAPSGHGSGRQGPPGEQAEGDESGKGLGGEESVGQPRPGGEVVEGSG